MTKNILRFVTLTVASAIASSSQTTSVFVSAGYSTPAPAQVAPGQVLTLFLRALGPLGTGNRDRATPNHPLPTSVAGLSARITQGATLSNVPIIEVRQQDTCEPGFSGPACLRTSIKVQIPFEVDANVTPDAQSGSVTLSPIAQLVLYADGDLVANTPVQPVPDNAHVLTTCDAEEQSSPNASCSRLVFHRNGTAVNADSPAMKGETVAVFLYRLGQTSPTAITGAAAEPGYAVTDVRGSPRVRVSLTAFVNAVGSSPRHGEAPESNDIPATITAGSLEGGMVGVYELTVALPESLPMSVPCGEGVRSNYILNVITSQGVEPVPVCIGHRPGDRP